MAHRAQPDHADDFRAINDPPMKRPQSRGQRLTQIAPALPLFMLFLLGVVDFGRGIYAYSVISNGAREGARYAIVHGALAQSIDGSCGSGPGASGTRKD